MQGQLLSVFNSFAFHNTTQILLASLTSPELNNILKAIERQPNYATLAHMIRATLVVGISHQVDRSLYFLHYCELPREELLSQRSSLVACQTQPQSLLAIAQKYCSLQKTINSLFQDQAEAVQEAVFTPELALPPHRRSTVAPGCQTVFQIALACQKLEHPNNPKGQTDQSSEFFMELLAFQVQLASLQLSAITDPFQHFAQLTYRFMVYRNSVLSLHGIAAFSDLAASLQPWKSAMGEHYLKANSTFALIAGLRCQDDKQMGNFTPALLRQEGYLNQYVQALVDLSIDHQSVAFCGHSRQQFGALYSQFQQDILGCLWQESPFSDPEEWRGIGLKPSTLLKMHQQLGKKYGGISDGSCARQDSYIESCAQIHGFMRVQCS